MAKGAITGTGGRIQEFTWDGELVWDYVFPTGKYLPHHDITKMPNGNVLAIAYEKKTAEQSTAAGRKGNVALEPDVILEVQPEGKDGGKIVWQWHIWDHLIQDNDASKANYGGVADHPELIDINLGGAGLANALGQSKAKDKGKGIGGGIAVLVGAFPGGNWTHANAISYHPELDQILLCTPGLHEIYIIDHSTTWAQAGGHSGGKHGKGGDLLYRWGNPKNYRAGTVKDQQLFFQHDAHWIPKGLPGAGHVLIFNNGLGRPGVLHSQVDEIILPVDAEGRYAKNLGTAFGPEQPAWTYTAANPGEFFSTFFSTPSGCPMAIRSFAPASTARFSR